jgi:hypothetical protein
MDLEYDDESSESYDPDQYSETSPVKSIINTQVIRDTNKSFGDYQKENGDADNFRPSAFNDLIASNQLDLDKQNESYEYSDDGEGIMTHEDVSAKSRKQKESVLDDPKFRSQMDSTDAFIAKHNQENVELSEEDKSEDYDMNPKEFKHVSKRVAKKEVYQPRNTYENMLHQVNNKLSQKKKGHEMQTFEQKKRALLGTAANFNAKEWDQILKHDGKNKLYEISNKRIKDSLIKGIPDHLRGRIWIFLSQGKAHSQSFNTSKFCAFIIIDFYQKLCQMELDNDASTQIDKDLHRT